MFLNLPRAKLAHLPTPLEKLLHLSAEYGPTLFMKRDDCTGLATGGNKTRILEYLLGDALERGCDTIVTGGSLRSNHCRQATAAARKYGVKPVLVLFGEQPDEINGNFLLDHILGADIRLFPEKDDRSETLQQVAEDLKDEGRDPYVVTFGGSQPLGIISYANALKEIMEQAEQRDITVDRIILTTGGGGTQAGLLIGKAMMEWEGEIIGMSISRTTPEVTAKIATLIENTVQTLDLSIDPVRQEDILVRDEYLGPGYGKPTQEMIEAVKLVARKEGILLDPVYTGKAFAGLLDRMRQGEYDEEETIVFIHTGGTPALFNPDFRELFLS